MKPLVVIRPQPGCDATIAAASARGLDAHGYPLFEVRPLPWDTPDTQSIDALLIGSANAVRHGGAALSAFAAKPVYAVGEKTAQACRNAGLEAVATGEGGLQELVGQLDPAHRRLLRLTGAVHVELTVPQSVTITERTVYSSDPRPMPDALAALLRQPSVVMLHSAEAARHFRAQCEDRDIALSAISLAAIGPRVAQAAGDGWQVVRTAERPSEDALLALAGEMCEEAVGSQNFRQGAHGKPMQDTTALQAPAYTPPSRRTSRGQYGVALMAFALGAAAVALFAWRGYLDPLLPDNRVAPQAEAPAEGETVAEGEVLDEAAKVRREMEAVSSVEARLAMMEDRFSRLDLQANAASGNAARAESLLIAFAARRMIDRGEPLRYLADQLQLRFANAQPRAVANIVAFAKSPVTIDELSARLEALSPDLAGNSQDESFWDVMMRDLSNLFTVHRETSTVMTPEARVERARVMLRAGRIPEAIAEVQRLPNADMATTWIADAQRYADAQRSLDLIETAAMLEPRRLQDSEGNRVKQPSPLASPAETKPEG